jgi:hypothetical protein
MFEVLIHVFVTWNYDLTDGIFREIKFEIDRKRTPLNEVVQVASLEETCSLF